MFQHYINENNTILLIIKLMHHDTHHSYCLDTVKWGGDRSPNDKNPSDKSPGDKSPRSSYFLLNHKYIAGKILT